MYHQNDVIELLTRIQQEVCLSLKSNRLVLCRGSQIVIIWYRTVLSISMRGIMRRISTYVVSAFHITYIIKSMTAFNNNVVLYHYWLFPSSFTGKAALQPRPRHTTFLYRHTKSNTSKTYNQYHAFELIRASGTF